MTINSNNYLNIYNHSKNDVSSNILIETLEIKKDNDKRQTIHNDGIKSDLTNNHSNIKYETEIYEKTNDRIYKILDNDFLIYQFPTEEILKLKAFIINKENGEK